MINATTAIEQQCRRPGCPILQRVYGGYRVAFVTCQQAARCKRGMLVVRTEAFAYQRLRQLAQLPARGTWTRI